MLFCVRILYSQIFKSRDHGEHAENLDMKEMIYTQTQKDVAETKIHHLLSENLFMPKNRVSIILLMINGIATPIVYDTIGFNIIYIFILINNSHEGCLIVDMQ